MIANGFCESGNCVRIEGDAGTQNHGLLRQVDLSGASTARLEFDYRRENYATCSTVVEVSDDGGGS